jgi:hypothetical protein
MDELKNGTYKEPSFLDEEFEKFGEKEEEFVENTGKKL